MIIYKITNLLNNKSYIGKTNNFDRRKREHFSSTALQNEPNKILYLAIEKYGKENFSMEIVEECKDDIWEEREKFYIQYYHTLTPNGYNMIDGGTEPPHYSGEECPAAN